jgi:hypothetical protein
MLAPPPGDAYNFLVNLISYPLSIVNVFVSAGLIYIYLTREKNFPNWNPGIRATLPVTIFFCLTNVYLVIAPLHPSVRGPKRLQRSPVLPALCRRPRYLCRWRDLLPRLGGCST